MFTTLGETFDIIFLETIATPFLIYYEINVGANLLDLGTYVLLIALRKAHYIILKIWKEKSFDMRIYAELSELWPKHYNVNQSFFIYN